MKDRRDKGRAPILAAGGIVLRGARKRQIAIVQLRKMDAWVLPKGKLAAGEDAIAAARREVLEETGHRVAIHEFLGTLAYEASGRPKVVSFWRMQAIGGPAGALMHDVRAVQWLPLDDALERLTYPREQAFLERVGPIALRSATESVRRTVSARRSIPNRPAERARALLAPNAIDRAERFVPADVAIALAAAPTSAPMLTEPARFIEAAPALDPARLPEAEAGRTMLERTWDWLRHAAQPLVRRAAG